MYIYIYITKKTFIIFILLFLFFILFYFIFLRQTNRKFKIVQLYET